MQHGRPGNGRLVKALVWALVALVVGFGGGMLAARLSQGAGLWADPSQESVVSAQPEAPDAPAAEDALDQSAPTVAYTTWSPEVAPNYYRIVGIAQVGEYPAAGTVAYGAIDELGRTTWAAALVTYDSMREGQARSRKDTANIYPSGWGHNREVEMAMPDGTIYQGFLFNRSHLVAKSLGGDDALCNLITGTRAQNVGANVEGTEGGMAYCEGLARSWLYGHPDSTLYYRATPAYEGDELVARSVIVDLRSSDGGLDQRIEVYNAARGFRIDYATGEFEITEQAEDVAEEIRAELGTQTDEQASERSAPVAPTGSPEGEDGERMVIVTGSGKAYHHDETCSGLVNARSMEWVTVSEAEAMGRHPCSICGG